MEPKHNTSLEPSRPVPPSLLCSRGQVTTKRRCHGSGKLRCRRSTIPKGQSEERRNVNPNTNTPEFDSRLSDTSLTISLGSASSSEVASTYNRSPRHGGSMATTKNVNLRSRRGLQVINRSELHYDNAFDKLKSRVSSWLKRVGLQKAGPVPLPLRARKSTDNEEQRKARDPRRYKRRGKFVTLQSGARAFEVWYELRTVSA